MAWLGESSSTTSGKEPAKGDCAPGNSLHDVFLSHSGVQKGFVRGLYERLCPLYSTFFDITHHSLPPGQSFPPRIFHAANTCKLAVLVLSHDFLKSRWPMLELHALINATPQPYILPLFFGISPNDLKDESNLENWRMMWAQFAAQDPSRINVTAWAAALRKVSSKNGLTFDVWEGQPAFIQRVVMCIFQIYPPSLRHDFSGIQGKDRLSKIVLAKFEALQTPSQLGICVLGMYGLPGSGKSTLCRCLCDYYFPHFSGKVLHLELPVNPTDAQLLTKSKELFKLTDFMDRVNLDGVFDILQVYQLLQNTNLQSSKVFLAVDNISYTRKTTEFVEALLRLGFGAGSKVLLVARTVNVLRRLLRLCQHHQYHHYLCGSTSVPGLNTEEALGILLQSGGGVGLAESYLREDGLNPEQWKDMEKVARMSGFGRGHDCPLYLPLVLKAMGNQLRWHDLDVKSWKREMEQFWSQGQLHKEDALGELLLESFKNLPEQLQILFLDVALFILPSSSNGIWYPLREACVVLSLIHDCSVAKILKLLEELQRDCFLTIMDELSLHDDKTTVKWLSMHDVYMEFAASVPKSSDYYWGSSRKRRGSHNAKEPFTMKLGLRTIILEQDEGLEHVAFPSGFSSVVAIVLRNCKSLTALLGLAGLTSLVSLDIENCPSLKWLECTAFDNLQKLGRVRWANMGSEMNVETQKQERSMIQWKEILDSTWSWMISTMSRRSLVNVGCLASRLRGLQYLKLENTGIAQLPELSQCWPYLRVLEIREKCLEHLQVCNLAELESFLLFGDGRAASIVDYDDHFLYGREQNRPREQVIGGRYFLSGCPKLEQVRVHSASLQGDWQLGKTLESSKLRSLWLSNFCHASELSHLAASAETLEELLAHGCRELSRLNFPQGMFQNLTKVSLIFCPSLIEVAGLEGLPSLLHLEIVECAKLQTLSGLSGLVSLERFEVGRECQSLVQALQPDLENLTKLREIVYYPLFPCLLPCVIFNMRNLVNLGALHLESINNIFDAGTLTGVEYLCSLEYLTLICTGNKVLNRQTICHSSVLVDLGGLLGVPRPLYSLLSGLRSMTHLSLEGLENLMSLRGIEFLPSLTYVLLNDLQNLSCLQGVESLVNLENLKVFQCASVEELPSLSALVNLASIQCWDCVKLKAVEGCGALRNLCRADFKGCKSLACFPLTIRQLPSFCSLEIERSKFASGEALVAWMEDDVPKPLRRASLCAMRWEFYEKVQEEETTSVERIKLGVMLLEMGAKRFSDGDCFDLYKWADLLETIWLQDKERFGGSFPASALEEVLRGGGRLLKHKLLHQCHSNVAFQLSVFNALIQIHPEFFVSMYWNILGL